MFVQPVAILSAVFSVVCSFLMCVSAVSGCQAGCATVVAICSILFTLEEVSAVSGHITW